MCYFSRLDLALLGILIDVLDVWLKGRFRLTAIDVSD